MPVWSTARSTTGLFGPVDVDQAVRPVLVLLEVGRVTTWVADAILGQEHAVCMVSPAWASPSDVCWPKSFRQRPLCPSLPDVLDEPTHGSSIACRLCGRQRACRTPTDDIAARRDNSIIGRTARPGSRRSDSQGLLFGVPRLCLTFLVVATDVAATRNPF